MNGESYTVSHRQSVAYLLLELLDLGLCLAFGGFNVGEAIQLLLQLCVLLPQAFDFFLSLGGFASFDRLVLRGTSVSQSRRVEYNHIPR